MQKTQNAFGHYVITADKGKILTNGEIYTIAYISPSEINESNWTEIDISEVPTENEEISDEEALSIIMGGVL